MLCQHGNSAYQHHQAKRKQKVKDNTYKLHRQRHSGRN